VYECLQDYEQALKLTQQAQLTAGSTTEPLPVGMARANFQGAGKTEAINTYEQSVVHLEKYRGYCHCQSRFTVYFRDPEPVYRELTELY